MTEQKIRYGAGGVAYYEQAGGVSYNEKVDAIETEKKELETSYQQSIANKEERTSKKKKKTKKGMQEIMGDDLVENKEMLDEII